MTYYCEDCGFVFYGAGNIRECPYCGMQRIHVSSLEEAETPRTPDVTTTDASSSKR